MNKTYHNPPSKYIPVAILLFIAVVQVPFILLVWRQLFLLIFPAILVLVSLWLVYRIGVTWQVNEVQIMQRDILRRETSLPWADLQGICSKSNSVLRLENLDGAHIDLPANLPGLLEILEFIREKRADLWRPDLAGRVLCDGNRDLILRLLLILSAIGYIIFTLISEPLKDSFVDIIFMVILLGVGLFSLFYYPYSYNLEDGVLHLKYWPAKGLFFRPADISEVQMNTTQTRNSISTAVSIRTQQGKAIHLGGNAYVYGVLRAWKDAG